MNTSETISTMNSEIPTNGTMGRSRSTLDHEARSPMSAGGTLGASTLSMRAKSARKRRVNAHHNSNFNAGFVPVEEDLLHRTGIRGRKRYFLYCAVGTLMLVTFLNLAVTAWLLHILGMTHYGMSSLEFLSLGGRDYMRVLTNARVDTVSMHAAPLGPRFDSVMELRTEEAQLKLEADSGDGKSSLVLDGENVTMTTKQFCMKTQSGDRWVSADLQSMVDQNAIVNLSADNMTARTIQEVERYGDLYAENVNNSTSISGHQGIFMETNKSIGLRATNVQLKGEAIKFDIADGIYLGNVPATKPRSSRRKVIKPNRSRRDPTSYKLCVCANTGRVFMVQANNGGRHASCDVGPQLQWVCGSSAN